jgi:hypothetical protein
MTYITFRNLLKGLLTGDNIIPEDEDVVLALLSSALLAVASKADSLHLMTLSTTANILRLAQGDYLIRIPDTPTIITTDYSALDLLLATAEEIAAAQASDRVATDSQLIDMDEELIPAVARYVASYISATKGGIHVQAAERIILDYNCKTWEVLEQMQLEADLIGAGELEYTAPSSEWNL